MINKAIAWCKQITELGMAIIALGGWAVPKPPEGIRIVWVSGGTDNAAGKVELHATREVEKSEHNYPQGKQRKCGSFRKNESRSRCPHAWKLSEIARMNPRWYS